MTLITVIIPVGPRHTMLLPDAVKSVRQQSMASECSIVVANDSGQPLKLPRDISVVDTGGGRWSSVARNQALRTVRTPFVTFLDADDVLTDRGLENLVRAYARTTASYVYGDSYTLANNTIEYVEAPEYSQDYLRNRNLHPITALIPTSFVDRVKGFDEELRGWEDWAFYMRLAEAGLCGERVPSPTLVYRLDYGTNRVASHRMFVSDGLLTQIKQRYHAFINEGKYMPCCGASAEAQEQARQAIARAAAVGDPNRVKLVFVGPQAGAVTFHVNGTAYRAGNNPFEKYVYAAPNDVPGLLALEVFRIAPELADVARPDAMHLPDSFAPFDATDSI